MSSAVSAIATAQLETSSVRVTRWDFDPGSETGDHQHEYDYVVVPVTNGVLTIEASGAKAIEYPIQAGSSYERKAGVTHNVKNDSASHVSFIEIELLEHPTDNA